jgi:hypothetical protein
MDQQKEDHRKSVADSEAGLMREREKWVKFISGNESEIIYHGDIVVHGFFSQCEKCRMWVKVTRSEELDYNAPVVRQIPLDTTAYGRKICDRCWCETKRLTYEENIGWISTLLKKHVINPSPAYAGIETMYNDGYRHFEHIGLAGPISSGPWDDDLREHLDDVIEFIEWKNNIFPKECKTEYDKTQWICVALAREMHKDLL